MESIAGINIGCDDAVYILLREETPERINGMFVNTEADTEYYFTDCVDGAVMYVKPEDAQYIIDPIMSEIFCYDADEHGMAIMDGYHWKLIFYKKDEVIDEIEGWPNEDPWRYGEVKDIIEFAERFISQDLGSRYMNFYKIEEA